MKVILLSAGQGKRLLPLTGDKPKCALLLGEKTALEWQLESLAVAGASEVVVATGFRHGVVRSIVHRFHKLPVRIAHNPFFAHCDNLGTCWIVRHEMTDPFVLINGDTMFEPEVFRRLIASPDSHDITLVTNEKDRLRRRRHEGDRRRRLAQARRQARSPSPEVERRIHRHDPLSRHRRRPLPHATGNDDAGRIGP